MQIKRGFKLRRIDDLYVVIAGASAAKDFHGMITLNETGAFLWEILQAPTTVDALVDALCKEYEIDRATAQADVLKLVEIARSQELLDE